MSEPITRIHAACSCGAVFQIECWLSGKAIAAWQDWQRLHKHCTRPVAKALGKVEEPAWPVYLLQEQTK